MKKILLTLALGAGIIGTNAQHLTLFEEFTGSNCGPCAATNPTIDALILQTQSNHDKILMVRYQAPVAGQGALYKENKADVDARSSYYRPQAAIVGPSARLDGKVFGPASANYPQHAAYIDQNAIDTQSAKSVPFTVEVTEFEWLNSANDSIRVLVTITANEAYDGNTHLQVALLQNLHYATAPGSNGEKSFEHVMRKMYPSAQGTILPATWTANQTETVEIIDAVPAHVDVQFHGMIASWVENRSKYEVLGVARSKGDVFPNSVPRVSENLSEVMVYPNPAASSSNTTLRLSLNESTDVNINITDVVGRTVHSFDAKKYNAGTHDIAIPMHKLNSGVFNVTISTPIGNVTRKLNVVK